MKAFMDLLDLLAFGLFLDIKVLGPGTNGLRAGWEFSAGEEACGQEIDLRLAQTRIPAAASILMPAKT